MREQIDDAMVERALRHRAFQEDGAQWPDDYSDDEQRMERENMRALLAAAHKTDGPQAYSRACQPVIPAGFGCYDGSVVHFIDQDRDECEAESRRDGSAVVRLIVDPAAFTPQQDTGGE